MTLIILCIVAYIGIGVVVLALDARKHKGPWSTDNIVACLIIMWFWPVFAPTMFALWLASLGKRKGGNDG